jgi:hypothetical protein
LSSFLFRLSDDGLVTLVHYHPDDEDELVMLKKVMTSTLSAKVVVSRKS